MELREAHRHNKGADGTTVANGDIVVIHSDNLSIGFWKLAKVK